MCKVHSILVMPTKFYNTTKCTFLFLTFWAPLTLLMLILLMHLYSIRIYSSIRSKTCHHLMFAEALFANPLLCIHLGIKVITDFVFSISCILPFLLNICIVLCQSSYDNLISWIVTIPSIFLTCFPLSLSFPDSLAQITIEEILDSPNFGDFPSQFCFKTLVLFCAWDI